MTTTHRNWAGNHTFSAVQIHYPETVEQVQALVSRASKVKVLGSRHSFNAIADSTGDLISLEYFVPRQHAAAAMRAVAGLQKEMAPVLLLSEVRTIAADTLWLSPSYQQATIGLHFSWHHNWPAVQRVLPLLEECLAPYQARPHWGKLFTMTPALLQTLYPKLPDFRNLLHHYDPQGKFCNAFLESYIMAGR